ncbi:hypothetical protein [Nocardia paucivorans]|uniref:hypothetical protein n=1 Tax=Nocardia paucivorans TaxID=114259 RepID=UPI0002D8E1EB|nr:hypothetical protein [Nocardia paucivorans]
MRLLPEDPDVAVPVLAWGLTRGGDICAVVADPDGRIEVEPNPILVTDDSKPAYRGITHLARDE